MKSVAMKRSAMSAMTCALAMVTLFTSPGYITGCGQDLPGACEPDEALYDKAQERIDTIDEQYLIEDDEGTLQVDLALSMVRRYDACMPASWVSSAYASTPCLDEALLRIDAMLDVTWIPRIGEPVVLADGLEMDGRYVERPDGGSLTLDDFALRQWRIDLPCDDAGCSLSMYALTPLGNDIGDAMRTRWLDVQSERIESLELSRRQ